MLTFDTTHHLSAMAKMETVWKSAFADARNGAVAGLLCAAMQVAD